MARPYFRADLAAERVGVRLEKSAARRVQAGQCARASQVERHARQARAERRARQAEAERSSRGTLIALQGIVFRTAEPSDADALELLAAFGGVAVPTGRVVVAARAGGLVAAVGSDGDAVADPFVPTAQVVRTLRAVVTGAQPDRSVRRRLRSLAQRVPLWTVRYHLGTTWPEHGDSRRCD